MHSISFMWFSTTRSGSYERQSSANDGDLSTKPVVYDEEDQRRDMEKGQIHVRSDLDVESVRGGSHHRVSGGIYS